MEQKQLCHITAVTEVMPSGQKCTKAILQYDRPISSCEGLKDSFEVKDRSILETSVESERVVLLLDPNDKAADLFCFGDPREHIPCSLKKAQIFVKQKKSIEAEDGTEIQPFDFQESDLVQNLLVDDFIQGEENGLKYNLFIPKGYDPSQKYPIVQFIHDAGPCGTDALLTLTQGIGAVIWASEEVQKKTPCFVYAPQFDGPPIVDDDWNVDPRLETAKHILDRLIDTYPIDKERIYTTGQSMGCMSSIVLNVRYPDYFAASFLVAGQWDERGIDGLEKQNLWMLNSQGDAKSYPVMNQMCVSMEEKGAKIAHKVMRADLTQEEYHRIAGELEATGANIIYTNYKLETVADGWHSNGGMHHVHTWRTAYQIEAIRDWMFSKRKAGIA